MSIEDRGLRLSPSGDFAALFSNTTHADVLIYSAIIQFKFHNGELRLLRKPPINRINYVVQCNFIHKAGCTCR